MSRSTPTDYHLEALENRLLLSADGLDVPTPEAVIPQATIEAPDTPVQASPDEAHELFAGLDEQAVEVADAPESQAALSTILEPDDELLASDSPDLTSFSERQVETLDAANGPPGDIHLNPDQPLTSDSTIVLENGAVLSGTGEVQAPLLIIKDGILSPGNSPGTTSHSGGLVLTEASTVLIEIDAAGVAGTDYDLVNITNNVTFAGTLQLDASAANTLVDGDTLDIFQWSGSRVGEFENYRGTTTIPGNQLVLIPEYRDDLRVLRLHVHDSETVAQEIERPIRDLVDLVDDLISVGDSTTQLPFIGGKIQDFVDAKNAVAATIQSEINGVIDGVTTQKEIAQGLEDLDGQTFGNFTVAIDSVRGNYTDAAMMINDYRFDVKATLTENTLTGLVEDVLGEVFAFVFGPSSTVDLESTVELDFAFGREGIVPYLVINEITFRSVATAANLDPLALTPPFPGSALPNVSTNATVLFEAFVTLAPDPVALPNGRINSPVIQDLPNPADFNTTKGATLDATLVLTTDFDDPLNMWSPLPLVEYDGVHTLRIVDNDLFDAIDPDMTLVVDGDLNVLGNTMTGVFTFHRAPMATQLDITADITELNLEVNTLVGPTFQVLKATGSGTFVLKDNGDLSGTGNLNIIEGPDIPGMNLSGLFTLEFDTATGDYSLSGDDALLTLALPELTLKADFVFDPDEDGPDKIVTVGFTDLSFTFVDPLDNTLVTLSNGEGAFVFTNVDTKSGMYGEITSADVMLNILDIVSLTGTFGGAINDFDQAFTKTVQVNATTVNIDVPAGEYLRVTAENATLDLDADGLTGLPLALSGNFAFEQRKDANTDEKLVTVGFTDVSLPFLDGTLTSILTIDDIDGIFVSRGDHLAGEATIGTFSFGDPSVIGINTNGSSLLGFQINTDPLNAYTASIDLGSTTLNLDVPVGPYVMGVATDVDLSVVGFDLIHGDFGFEQRESMGGSQMLTIVGRDMQLNLGDDVEDYFALKDGKALFAINSGQFAGQGMFFVETPTSAFNFLQDDDPVTTGVQTLMNFSFNNSASTAIDEIFDWEGTPTPIKVPAGEFLGVSGAVGIAFDVGPLSQEFYGDFTIFQAHDSNEGDYVGVSVEDLSFSLAAGSLNVLALKEGVADLAFFNDGVAGTGSLAFDVGLVGITGDIDFDFNTRTSPVNIVDGPAPFSQAETEFLRLCIDGHISVGPLTIPLSFNVEISGGDVVFEEKTGALKKKVTVDSSGNITTENFPAAPSFDLVDNHSLFSMLKQLILYADVVRDSAIMDAEIPFTGGTTLGEVLDYSKLLLQVYAEVATVELRSEVNFDSPSLSPLPLSDGDPLTGILANTNFLLNIGNDAPVEVQLTGVYTDNATLIDRLNAAFVVAGIDSKVEARINRHLQVVIALLPAELEQHSVIILSLKDVADDTDFEQILELGFSDGQGGVEDALDEIAGFVQDLGIALGVMNVPTYDPNARLILYEDVAIAPLNESYSFDLDLGSELGPIGRVDLDATVEISASAEIGFTVGFDLNARDVPHAVSSPFIPVPSDGQLSDDASFELYINGPYTDAATEHYSFTLPAASTAPNSNAEDLAADLNGLFAAEGLQERIVARPVGGSLTISALNEDLDLDGVTDFAGGVDLDLGPPGLTDSQLGIITSLQIIALQDDVFATEVGYAFKAFSWDHDDDPLTDSLNAYLTDVRSPVKGLFLEDFHLGGSFSLSTPGGIAGSLNLGFVEIQTDPGASFFQTDANITVSIDFEDQNNGRTRFYATELMQRLDEVTDMVSGVHVSGGFSAALMIDTTELSALGFNLPAAAGVSILIPDINDLTYNEAPYTPGLTGTFVDFTDLGGVGNFSKASFFDLIGALSGVVDSLAEMETFSFLDEKIPFIEASFADLLSWVGKVADLLSAVTSGNAGSLQDMLDDFESEFENLFGLSADNLAISVEDVAAPAPTLAGDFVDAFFNPNGSNNGLKFQTANTALTSATIKIVGSQEVSGDAATAAWDADTETLTVQIDSGKTTAATAMAAVNDLDGTWTVSLTEGGGTGTLNKTTIKISLSFDAGYANTLPLQLNLKDMLSKVSDNPDLADFLEQATTFLNVGGSGILDVSVSASLQLDFGLDITNPCAVNAFMYDTTGITISAEVLGTELEFEASMGSLVGIFIKGGVITFDADGDPDTPGKAEVRLGLKDDADGDGRLYFDDNFFDAEHISFSANAGLKATLPIYAPTEGNPVDGDGDDNSDGYPDNWLVIDIPDILRFFSPDTADGDTATIEMRSINNDFTVSTSDAGKEGFRVVFENDFDMAPNAEASYSAGTLLVKIKSNTTTANEVITAISMVTDFSAASTADDDGEEATTTNDGTGTVAKTTVATPDFSNLFGDLDLCSILDSHAGLLLDGLDALLGTIQDGLNDFVLSTRLPLIGDGLSGAANFIESFRDGLLTDLRTALEASGGSASAAIEDALKQVFWDWLGPDGLNILVDDNGDRLVTSLGASQLNITLDCEDGLFVGLIIGGSIDLIDTTGNPIDFDIGVPGFGLEIDGNVVVELVYEIHLGFGLNAEHGFYYDTSSDPEMFLGLEASIPDLVATGSLLFLTLTAEDDGDDPSSLSGGISVDITDPDGDGKLTFAEMTSAGVSFGDIFDADIAVVADLNIKLAGGFSADAKFPRVVADLLFDWEWSITEGATDPSIQIANVGIDLGSYVSDFILPILTEINDLTKPLQPIIDVVTPRLPIISDLAGRDLNMLDLWEANGTLSPGSRRFIEVVIQIIEFSRLADDLTKAGNVIIPLGSFLLQTDQSGAYAAAELLSELEDFDPEDFLAEEASGPPSNASASAGFAGDVASMDNFSIPIFDNPMEIANLFIGKPVSLIEYKLPVFSAEAEFTFNIPIFDALNAQFGGRVSMKLELGIGYDSFGIQKFIESKDAIDIFDGFYFIDFDDNGNDRDELFFEGQVFAGAVIDLAVAEAGVRGGIGIEVGFDLNDPNQDGRVRVSEIVSNARLDPRCIFNIHGEVFLYLEAFLIIDLFFFTIDETWEFGRVTLFEFESVCPEPELYHLVGTEMFLNMGTDADERKYIDTDDTAEHFIVTHIEGDENIETVEVKWNGYVTEVTGITKVVVTDAGQGDDIIELRGVLVPVDISGGVGSDIISLTGRDSAAGGILNGNDGNDILLLSGMAEGMVLNGDAGSDVITAGAAAIEAHGGSGSDLIIGSSKGDHLFGDSGSDQILSGLGNDYVEGGSGNDDIDAGGGDDQVLGGDGADTIIAGLGNDIVDGGASDDSIDGGSGNDILAGGTGSDSILGKSGVDLLIGDTWNAGSWTGTLATSNANAIALMAELEKVQTNTDVNTFDLSVLEIGKDNMDGSTDLSGADFIVGGGSYDILFGDGGDDFLFGGNFFATGETEVFEEDDNDFIDGGRGNDEIFGDDAHGKTGERDTGISIESAIWLDLDQDGIQAYDEEGVSGVRVKLMQPVGPFNELIDETVTDNNGAFKFTGLDPDEYFLVFDAPYDPGTQRGLVVTPLSIQDDPSLDNYAIQNIADPSIGTTDPFELSINETLRHVTAGFVGNAVMSIGDVTIDEGDFGSNAAIFEVSLSIPTAANVTVDYATIDGSATSLDDDYDATSGTLVFAPGETVKYIVVPVHPDYMYEGSSEDFDLVLSNLVDDNTDVALQTWLEDSVARAVLVGDDEVPRISISDAVPDDRVALIENQPYPIPAEADDLTFTISLSNPTNVPVTVHHQVVASEAFEPSGETHYASVANAPGPGVDLLTVTVPLVTIPAGETEVEVTIRVEHDDIDEYEEHFFVQLYDVNNALIGDAHGVGVILDDDDAVLVWMEAVTPSSDPHTTDVDEGQVAYFEVKLLDPVTLMPKESGKDVRVSYSTQPNTAVSVLSSDPMVANPDEGPDYIAAAGNVPEEFPQLSFAPGETSKIITIETVDGDYLVEPDESFFLNLIQVVDADIGFNHGVINIIDNDSVAGSQLAPIRFSEKFYHVEEGDDAQITLIRNAGASTTMGIFFTNDLTASSPDDYDGGDYIVEFLPNEYEKIISIPTVEDGLIEADETVYLTMRGLTGKPASAAPFVATLIIHDDELRPVIHVDDVAAVTEGVDPHVTITFSVTQDGPIDSGQVVLFDIHTEDITAAEGADYTHSTILEASITVPVDWHNWPSHVITIPIIDDGTIEVPETFRVYITNPQFSTIGTADTIVTIYDDEEEIVNGRIFLDANGNGFFDSDERVFEDVAVEVTGLNGSASVLTDPNGEYHYSTPHGPVTIAVNEDSLVDTSGPIIKFYSGYELTTGNDNQTIQFEGGGGVLHFEDIGYQPKRLAFALPAASETVGRGGTDDTLFGGPGDDFIDAGGGDDHVVGGHWMQATNTNAPVVQGLYDANLIIYEPVNPDDSPLNGYIWDVDTSSLGDTAQINGNVWEDKNMDGDFDPIQGTPPLVTYEGISGLDVFLLDKKHNIVDQASTGIFGDYHFQTYPGEYIVQVEIPDGWTENPNLMDAIPTGWVDGAILLNPVNGRSFVLVTVADGQTESLDIELAEGVIPAGSENADFAQPVYVIDQGEEDTLAVITVNRTNALIREAVVYQTSDGSAQDGVHYNQVQGTLYFEVGEFAKSFVVPVLASGSIPECGTVELHLNLRNAAGRLINDVDLEIQHFAGGESDNDTIEGGDDWDIILGDSGNIPGNLHPGRFPDVKELILDPGTIPGDRLDPYQVIRFSGGPGADAINAGKSFDYVFGQGFEDFINGDQGKDYIDAGVGDDYIIAEYSNDAIQGGPGFDKLFAKADADFEIRQDHAEGFPHPGVDTLKVTYHANNNTDVFTLQGIDHIQLIGGNADNDFIVSDWDGFLEIEGGLGSDAITVINDTDMTLEALTGSSAPGQLLLDIGAQLALVKGSLGLSSGGADVTEAINLVSSFPVTSTSSLTMFAHVVAHDLFDLSGYIFNNTKATLTLGNGSLYSLSSIEDANLTGGPGANTIDASRYGGDVNFDGRGGNDDLIGGGGNDTFFFSGTEIGTTRVTGNGSVAPADTDIDTIDFSSATTPVVLDLEILGASQAVAGSLILEIVRTDIDNLRGGQGDDILKGNALDNELSGGPGSDELHGRDGSETYAFDADSPLGLETIVETGVVGHDVLDFSATDAAITIDLTSTALQTVVPGNLFLQVDASGIEELIGGSGDDHITGNAQDNILRGGPGNDTIFGLGGDDFIDGGDGNDYQDGGDGSGDFIDESADADFELTDTHIFRGDEVDVLVDIEEALLTGGPSANTFTLSGWSGDVTIDGGGHGSDTLIFAADADFTLLDTVGPTQFKNVAYEADGVSIQVDHAPADGTTDQVFDVAFVEFMELSGGESNNTFDASALTDGASIAQRSSFTFNGDDGDDTFLDSPWNDILNGEGGTDTVNVNRDADVFYLSSDNIVVDVDSSSADPYQEDNFITGIEQANVTGGPSDNLFDITNWLGGNVSIDGGAHIFWDVIRASVDGSATVSDAGITLPGGSGSFTVANVEVTVLIGGDNADILDASAYSGIAFLLGNGGDDDLRGGSGGDFLFGGDDNDILSGNGGDDHQNGGEGDDTYLFTADTALGSDDIDDPGGTDTLDFSGTQLNNLTVLADTTGVQIVNGFLEIDILSANIIENLIGGAQDDLLRGNLLDNVLEGGPGMDALDGRLGNDTLIGGPDDDLLEGRQGNDLYLFDADDPLGHDTIMEVNGFDTIDYSATTTLGVSVNLLNTAMQVVNINHRLTISGATDIEKLIGGSQADVLQGNTLDNTISGGGGDDIIDGNGGVNWVLETADADFVLSDSQLTIGAETDSLLNINHAWLIGGAGNNLINASAFTLGWVYLEGLQGDDTLLGGSHGDLLLGGEDDDILEGGDGNDFLDAGLGDDTYVYDLTNPQGADIITESEGEGLDTVTGLDPLEFDVNINTPQVIGPNLTITLWNEDPLSPDSVIEAVISP